MTAHQRVEAMHTEDMNPNAKRSPLARRVLLCGR